MDSLFDGRQVYSISESSRVGNGGRRPFDFLDIITDRATDLVCVFDPPLAVLFPRDQIRRWIFTLLRVELQTQYDIEMRVKDTLTMAITLRVEGLMSTRLGTLELACELVDSNSIVFKSANYQTNPERGLPISELALLFERQVKFREEGYGSRAETPTVRASRTRMIDLD